MKWEKIHIERRETNKRKWTTTQWYNDRADHLANKIWTVDRNNYMYPKKQDQPLPQTSWHFKTLHRRVNRSISTMIYDHNESLRYEEYFQKKWPDTLMNEIAWHSLELVTQNKSIEGTGSFLKTVHSQWATLDIQATQDGTK